MVRPCHTLHEGDLIVDCRYHLFESPIAKHHGFGEPSPGAPFSVDDFSVIDVLLGMRWSRFSRSYESISCLSMIMTMYYRLFRILEVRIAIVYNANKEYTVSIVASTVYELEASFYHSNDASKTAALILRKARPTS